MIELKLSHHLCGKVTISQRYIRFINVVMQDGALGITMLKDKSARFSSTSQSGR
jgi:hypothetical protein